MNGSVPVWIGVGLSLLIQAVAYGKLIEKVNQISIRLTGADGDGGLVDDVETLKLDVTTLKAQSPDKAHGARA